MQLPEVAIPDATMRDLLSRDPSKWQTALVAVAIANDRFDEDQVMARVHFYKRGTIQ